MREVLLAVAHGSRDPAAQDRIHALTGRVRQVAGNARVATAFVQHASPSLAGALARMAAEADAGLITIVPLLLSSGYHLSTDIAGAASAAGAAVAGPLGPDPRLTSVLAGRLAQAGVPAGTPVVLAAAGSSDPRAAVDTGRQAALLAAHLAVPVMPAFVTAARPTVEEAVAALARRAGRPVAVAAYLLAPGIFHDRLHQAGAAWVSAPLGDHLALARLVAARFGEAVSCPRAA